MLISFRLKDCARARRAVPVISDLISPPQPNCAAPVRALRNPEPQNRARVTGASRLDPGVQGQKVGLDGEIVDV